MLFDTSIAILLRDGDEHVVTKFGALARPPILSIIGLVELENGVVRRPEFAALRRRALDALLAQLTIVDFDARCGNAYRMIVEARGYSRARVTDRMIAATAIVEERTLITRNVKDFHDIPGLLVEEW